MALQQVKNSNGGFSLLSQKQKQILARFTHVVGEWLLNYWATVITVVLGLIVAIALSIPFLWYFGLDTIGKPVFILLHFICAPVPSHSFYLFGLPLCRCDRILSLYLSTSMV